MAKAAIWPNTDTEVRKHGEQTGLPKFEDNLALKISYVLDLGF